MLRLTGMSPTLLTCLVVARLWATDAHDDGITAPYAPPEEHRKYVENLSPELAARHQTYKDRIRTVELASRARANALRGEGRK